MIKVDLVRVNLAKINVHKSMGPDSMHPQMPQKLADVTARPLPLITGEACLDAVSSPGFHSTGGVQTCWSENK